MTQKIFDPISGFFLRQSKIKNLELVGLVTLVLAFVGLARVVAAQQPKKVPRIGYLSQNGAATESVRSEAIRRALRELGYVEGRNIAIEYRYADGNVDRVPELAAELVRLKIDVIVAAGGVRTIRRSEECNQDDSYRYGRRGDGSCCGRCS